MRVENSVQLRVVSPVSNPVKLAKGKSSARLVSLATMQRTINVFLA